MCYNLRNINKIYLTSMINLCNIIVGKVNFFKTTFTLLLSILLKKYNHIIYFTNIINVKNLLLSK